MLKAVRFDPEEHKELIEFVENYRDKKNRPNHSEAIRFLMAKGLEYLKQQDTPKPTLDIESIKNEIFHQIMAQIQSTGITLQHQQPTYQPVRENPIRTNIKEQPVSKPIQQPQQNNLPKKIATNPLLANILSNSQR